MAVRQHLPNRLESPLFVVANPTLEEGKRAPAFTLPSTDGDKFRLTEHRGRWIVAYFYPKDLTPGCTTEAENFRDALDQFEDQGAVVVGISPDPMPQHEKFSAKLDKTRAAVVAKHNCADVRFEVYVKNGKAALKAVPTR